MSHITRRQAIIAGATASVGVALTGCADTTATTSESAPAVPWDELKSKLGNKVIEPTSPLANCVTNSASAACKTEMTQIKNPFWLQDQPGATQTQGWLNAWDTVVSPYAVAARTPQDIATAVKFATENNVRLVTKGAGHDYLSRNVAPDSLLIWTHHMRQITVHDDFVPGGSSDKGQAAITVEAGTRWIETYMKATQNNLYVQGGGCTSVGASGGFIQGSGFGSFSKKFGTGAAGVLEFEVVTAAGEVVVANANQNSDLFWALRGGGGGTFGVVTKTTLLAHPIPSTMGIVSGTITATSDQSFRELLLQTVKLLPDLDNPDWGEQIRVHPDNSLSLGLVFLDIPESAAKKALSPLTDWVSKQDSVKADIKYRVLPFKDQWNASYWEKEDPEFITLDSQPGAPERFYWWTSNGGEVSWFINAYHSRWLPKSALEKADDLATVFFEASRSHNFIIQLNKGLSGEEKSAKERDLNTSLHPAAFESPALLLVVSGQQGIYPEVEGFGPADDPELADKKRQVDAAAAVFRRVWPEAGSYANEADYFEDDWQNQFWGDNYSRLLEVKKSVDPNNVFRVHHGVGSDQEVGTSTP